MKKLILVIAVLTLAACSDQPTPAEPVDVEAFLKAFDCDKLEQHTFDDEELKRRTRVYCAMKTEHKPSKPERHTFG